MTPKTKSDKFIEKLIDLTSGGFLPWQEVRGNYDYPIAFQARTPVGFLEIRLKPKKALIVTSNNEEWEYEYEADSPFLETLIRATRDYIYTPWAVEKIVRKILEGALDEDSERVDDTVQPGSHGSEES